MTGNRLVVAAMSGGVDSSVAAALLLEKGFQVIGATLKLQECPEAPGSRPCCGSGGAASARAVAGRLGIPHYTVDCAREFSEQVLRPAWEEYDRGRTPSPCLLCNERIKFGALLDWARGLGAELLATGHYARKEVSPRGEPRLRRASDPGKDQSYFLSGLDSHQLASAVFPLGELTKREVRARARSLGLPSAEAPDSQDACLGGAGAPFAEMLRLRFGGESRPGPVLDLAGRVLGRHRGIHLFTVGQRKGIPVPGRRWVKEIRAGDSAVVTTENEADLAGDRFVVSGLGRFGEDLPGGGMECEVRIRSRAPAEPARLEPLPSGEAGVVLRRPARAITPGQAAVFSAGELVLGRGWIR